MLENKKQLIMNEEKSLSLIYPDEYKELTEMHSSDVYQLGPVISKYILPDDIFDGMKLIVEDVLKSEEKERFGYHLAGQIDSEYLIPHDILKEKNVFQYFENAIRCYIKEYCTKLGHKNALTYAIQSKVDVGSMWIVEQFKNEYNPVHWHENCTISAVMYLEVPDMYNEGDIPNKRNAAGDIVFINKSAPSSSLESPILNVSPKEKELYIFPGHLMHSVYPFDNDVRRLSVSFNTNHSITEVDTKKLSGVDVMSVIEKIKESKAA